jgi:hypothetical protein
VGVNDNVSNKAKKIQSKTLTVGFNTPKIIWYRNIPCLIVGYKQKKPSGNGLGEL